MDKEINVFQYAANCEAVFEQFMQSEGKERKTTFFNDLSFAEWFGETSVIDTYNAVMREWKDDINYMCEWVISLNQKIWQHSSTNKNLAELYYALWRRADNYCCKHFEGEELDTYYDYID